MRSLANISAPQQAPPDLEQAPDLEHAPDLEQAPPDLELLPNLGGLPGSNEIKEDLFGLSCLKIVAEENELPPFFPLLL